MKRLPYFHLVRNYYISRTYATYTKLFKSCHATKLSLLPKHFSTFSHLYSLQNATLNSIASLKEEFPEPKKILTQIINKAYICYDLPDLKPDIVIEQITFGENQKKMWQFTITMNWPKTFKVDGIAEKKHEAEKFAFLQACHKMKEFGMLDDNNKPCLPDQFEPHEKNDINNAKSTLGNIFIRLWARHGRKDYVPKYKAIQQNALFGNEKFWKCELHLQYPEPKIFIGSSTRLKEAEGIAATKALLWLQEQQVIDKKKRLVHYTQEELKQFKYSHTAPYSICIPVDLQDKMMTTAKQIKEDIHKELYNDENFCFNEENINSSSFSNIYNILTDEIYFKPSEEEIIKESRKMFEQQVLLQESSEPHLQDLKQTRSMLPIFQKKNEIINLLNENQILVISGDTGCGKTTQVPQYILEHYISQMKGATCNIVVTQPRRISAITIAERVATERNEKVGNTVGYHVRLKKNLPHGNGSILYCTTGMLLRKLSLNPNLEGVSHVIIDEVHERNIQIDFILILLKKLLQINQDIKILLMSASFNSLIFSKYFNNCPILHVSGLNYPVKVKHIEDIIKNIKDKRLYINKPVLDSNLIAKVIHHIDSTQGPGAILCFLPGWHEIKEVHSKILAYSTEKTKFFICPIHSNLPHNEQKQIFLIPNDDTRKIILATNIAETSITIPDVKYVVDSGLHKGTSFDCEKGTTSLATQWITKANIRQRRGRAGRVQSGICYHLFPRKIFMEMDDYPKPDILKMPLESVILDCKLHCPEVKAENFLSAAIEPPNNSSLRLGIKELENMDILDDQENLTKFGKVIVHFGTHPRLSAALVYASFLRCLNPVLTICAMLTVNKEPFLDILENKSHIKEIKLNFDNNLFSDHIALSKIFDTWEKLEDESSITEFAKKNSLDIPNMTFIKQLKALFAEDLYDAGIINDPNVYLDPESIFNENSNHIQIILAALTVAFYPNVIKILQGEIANGKLKKDALIYSVIKGQKGYIQKESVVSNECELPSPWLIYFSAMHSGARKLLMASSVSCIPGICLLLLTGKKIEIQEEPHNGNDEVILLIDDLSKLNFSCTKEAAQIIKDWNQCLKNIFQIYLQNLTNSSNQSDILKLYDSSFLPLLKDVLETPQVPLILGEIYKFVDNVLVSEQLYN